MFEINYLEVIAAAIGATILGMIWYGPIFGQKWMKLVKISKKDLDKGKKDMPKTIIISILSSMLTAYILSVVLNLIGTTDIILAASYGIIFAVGFVAMANLSEVLWERRPIALFNINTGFSVVNYAIMSVIITII